MNTKQLKIGLVFDDSLDSSDGVAQYVKTLGAWLSGQKYEVTYLVGETRLEKWAGGKVYSLAKNLKVAFNRNHLSVPLPGRQTTLRKLLKTEHFDLIHVQVPYSPFMAQRVIKKVPQSTALIGTFHILPANRLASWGSRLLRLVIGRSLRRFDQIVSVSQPAADFAKRAFGLDTIVIPNAVDIASFAKTAAKPKRSGHKVVFLGRLVERKGAKQLLQAFSLLHEQRPQTRLVIAGDGPLRSTLESYVKKAGLSSAVKFKGFIKEADKAKLLASADIACFPALGGESFGIVLIEAMAAGAGLVIGGDNPGYRKVLGGREEALINPFDTVNFAERLQILLDDKKLASELHEHQQLDYRQYDIEIVGRQLLDVYKRAIAKHPQ